MSSDQDNNMEMPFKKVRFSDEKDFVYEYEREDDIEKNKSDSVSNELYDVEVNEISTDDSLKKNLDINAKEADYNVSMSDNNNLDHSSNEPFDCNTKETDYDVTMSDNTIINHPNVVDSSNEHFDSNAKEADYDVTMSDNTIITHPNVVDSSNEHFVSNAQEVDYDVAMSGYPINNNNPDMVNLNLLCHETNQMTISPSEQGQADEVNRHLSPEQYGHCHICDDDAENIDRQIPVEPIAQTPMVISLQTPVETLVLNTVETPVLNTVETPVLNTVETLVNATVEKIPMKTDMKSTEHTSSVTCLTRKRSLGGEQIKRQSSKVNTYLKSETVDLNSATAITTAVFNAWNKAKTETAKTDNASVVPEMKGESVTPPKPSKKNSKGKQEFKFKNIKNKAKFEEPEPIIQKKKEDTDESKMGLP